MSVIFARKNEKRHILTRAVGVVPYVEFGYHASAVAPGDVVLLCSDGLTAHYTDRELENCLRDEQDLGKLADSLIIGTCARGGKDNVTLMLARVE